MKFINFLLESKNSYLIVDYPHIVLLNERGSMLRFIIDTDITILGLERDLHSYLINIRDISVTSSTYKNITTYIKEYITRYNYDVLFNF